MLKIAKILGLKVQSWHIFRKVRLERAYSILRDFLRFLRYREKNRQGLIVDGKLLKLARLERALTQKIKRGLKGLGWDRRKRKLYSVHKQKERECLKNIKRLRTFQEYKQREIIRQKSD